ncbi:MAG TPA: glycoside hydrolase family 2 TIM barrel-domain containing protein [Micromonosporaceae bacterium]|nr:glycoside hydrolase family 2 TIM barrel-domain containing protein [Micromonosporaceae bacterium]
MRDANDTTPTGLRRRTVLIGAAGAGTFAVGSSVLGPAAVAEAATASRRVVYNLNPDWRFIQRDVAEAHAAAFDDAGWTVVSVPHTFNDVDSFDEFIGNGGEATVAQQVVWYRKRFTLPSGQAGRKVLLEFEGIRQAATVYVNGTEVGLYEYGVTPFGFDITDQIRFDAENVIAVKADNSRGYQEKATGTPFHWDALTPNPTYGGLTRNVRLYVLPKTYFTLPLYTNLRTVGTYVYPSDISVADRTATITAEAQIRNEQSDPRTVTVRANILNARGRRVHTLTAAPVTLGPGQTEIVKLSGRVANLTFWDTTNPYLYTVEMVLSEGGRVQDAYPIRTGFRKTEFRGGATDGGVYLNDRYVFLTGYAQRSTNEWAVIGGAVPEWMTDLDNEMVRASKANLIRWMHIAATPANIRATDRNGIVSIQPAADSERDAVGRQWDQRVEVMRDTLIYFRNSPSILFWEAGNQHITAAHMAQMTELRKVWDPHGGRAMGCRAISDNPAYGGTAAVDAAEYVGTMLNRHYSVYARDRMPLIESEYTRDEAPRRVWDAFSPPDFGYIVGPKVTYRLDSEQFAGPHAAKTRWEFWGQRIQGPGDRRYSGAAALLWADSNQHGRQYEWECARLSGRVDAVRIPKESLHTFRVMQSATPDIHVIGHWTYPDATVKPIYVMAANVARVALLVNDVEVASSTTPMYDFLYTFPAVTWQAGTIAAVGYDAAGVELVRSVKATTGMARMLRLTPHTAPGGLRADGSDIAYFDVEAVDDEGRRVPTHQDRIDFTLEGPGAFLGGFNSNKPGSVHKPYVDTEAGTNRVFVRAGRTPGPITVTAFGNRLTPAAATITSVAFPVGTGGLTTRMPTGY